MANAACPLCGQNTGSCGEGLRRCAGCGFVSREKKYFGEPVYEGASELEIYSSGKKDLFDLALARLGRLFPEKGTLLDIGCAGGEFLKAAAARGWLAEGLEIAPDLAGKAAGSGFTVHTKPVESAGLRGEAYCAVTVFEVFSQMENPGVAAAELFRIVKPGGALYVREFNASFHLALHRLELAGLFKPLGASPAVIHNFNFTARSLRVMLERAGFRDVRVRNSRPTSGDPYRSGGLIGGFLTGLLKFLYYILAQALWYGSFGRVYAGSALIVTARK